MPLPSDPSGPERSRERASWFAWMRQVAPVAVPLVLFVQIVAWGIAPALEKRASLLEKLPQVQEDWNLAQSELEQARREEQFLESPIGQERFRRRVEDEEGARAPQEVLRELATPPSRPKTAPAGTAASSATSKKAR